MVGGALVVGTAEPPLAAQAQIVLEVGQQILGRHGSAGEEVLAHPVAASFGLEVIGEQLVHEDVYEQPPLGLEPARDLGQQQTVVLHVLEHLDRKHTVETARKLFVRKVELDNIASDDPQIAEATIGGLLLDVGALALRIRQAGDTRTGVVLRQP